MISTVVLLYSCRIVNASRPFHDSTISPISHHRHSHSPSKSGIRFAAKPRNELISKASWYIFQTDCFPSPDLHFHLIKNPFSTSSCWLLHYTAVLHDCTPRAFFGCDGIESRTVGASPTGGILWQIVGLRINKMDESQSRTYNSQQQHQDTPTWRTARHFSQ